LRDEEFLTAKTLSSQSFEDELRMKSLESIASDVVDSAFKVHSKLGPGLLESAYEACLEYELVRRGYFVERQKAQAIEYDGVVIDVGYRIDLLVENAVLIELKAVEQLAPIHHAQILTYLKLSQKNIGFLINFNVPLIKNGIRRVVNQYQGGPPDQN
jgi:GxxExxY protein